MQLIDKHVPITGGSAGLGLALARALIDAGVRVTICGRSRPRLEAAVRSHGPLDVLVNNAGSQQLMDFSRDGQQRPIAEELQFNLTAPCAGSSPVLALGVVEVIPPLVDTAMTADRGRGKLSPEAAAAEIVAGLRSGRDAIFMGRVRLLRLSTGLSPRLGDRITRR